MTDPSTHPSTAPPPGWYFDGAQQRWWDGREWTPHVAPQRKSDDRTLSIVSHLGVVAGGFILPLVLYLVSTDEERPETRWNAREALNFQLTFLLVYVVGFVALFLGLIGVGAFSATYEPGLGFGAVFGVFMLGMIVWVVLNFVFSIMGALRANQGERWRYPLSIRFVRS